MSTLGFSRLGSVDFFSGKKAAWNEAQEICIGTQSKSLTEALLLSSLPSKLKSAYPSLKVYALSRPFNSVVFQGNPHIDKFKHMPKEIFGDEIQGESGHLIQIRERFFSLPVSHEPKPEIYLTESEKINFARFLSAKLLPVNAEKPLCVLQAWDNPPKVAPVEFWDSIVDRWKNKFRFWQLGVESDSAIRGCEYYFFTRPTPAQFRRHFALIYQANLFIGIDSSSLHIARAFDKPSLILLNELAQGPESRRHYIHPLVQYTRVNESKVKIDEFLRRYSLR